MAEAFLEGQPFPQRGLLTSSSVVGVVDTHAAQIYAGDVAAAVPSQPDGGGTVAAAKVKGPGLGPDASLLDHDAIEVGAALQEIGAGGLVEVSPVDAAILIPDSTVDGIFGIIVCLCFLFSEPARHA